MGKLLAALAMVAFLVSPATAWANGPAPTESDCQAGLAIYPSRTARLLFLRQSAVQTCLHFGWRDGNDGLNCYEIVLYQQLTENWVYTERDTNARYNDCLEVAYGGISSSSQQYPKDISTPDGPGQAMIFPWATMPKQIFVVVRGRPNPYHYVQPVVALP